MNASITYGPACTAAGSCASISYCQIRYTHTMDLHWCDVILTELIDCITFAQTSNTCPLFASDHTILKWTNKECMDSDSVEWFESVA